MKPLNALVPLTAACALLFSGTPAHACSCLIDWTPLANLADADAVFTGRVMEVTPLDGPYGEELFVYELEVHAVWKGQDQPIQAVLSNRDTAACGVLLLEGEDYLLYVDEVGGALRLYSCSRSRAVQFAQEDFDALGDPISVDNARTSITMLKARFER